MDVGRPLVTWKFGASLDGRLAAADGSSQWITSAEARTDAHRLRAESDAVMVGSGTQQADNPHLAVRHVEASRQPLRVVVDSRARTPAGARVLDERLRRPSPWRRTTMPVIWRADPASCGCRG